MSSRKPSATQHSTLSTQHFSWPVRVYYEDTDLGGIVYYANYLRFLERARTEWLRALGFEQSALAAVHQVVFVVRSIALDFLKPSRIDDTLEITVSLREAGASRIALSQFVRRGAEDLVAAQVELACVNTATFRPVRIPGPVIARIGRKT
ncbi:MAG TPA: tol-pal system-associated acyl-CoA thioesterase [Burkholderiales bacterium]|nr:tol-pal system-associated acyl-CoA thioesterase [Burkholderiales bacterium]